MNGRQAKSSPESRHRVALVIWGAQMSALVMLLALTRVVAVERRGGENGGVILLALAAAGLTTFGLSFALKAKLLSQAAAQRRPELASSAYVAAFALCEACALFGVVAHFVTGAPESLYFFVPAALGLALHFPRRANFEDAPRGTTFGEDA